MPSVRETKLPGVGVRHEFTTANGAAMAVIVHHDGRRELMSYDIDDPDACHSLVSLNEHDTQTLAEILGVSHVTETVDMVRQAIDGLAIDWVDIVAGASTADSSIADGMYRTRTGSSIVAVIRGETSVPAPEPDFVLKAGDVVVAVGTPDGLTSLRTLLSA